jgi:hypothetical protein
VRGERVVDVAGLYLGEHGVTLRVGLVFGEPVDDLVPVLAKFVR